MTKVEIEFGWDNFSRENKSNLLKWQNTGPELFKKLYFYVEFHRVMIGTSSLLISSDLKETPVGHD